MQGPDSDALTALCPLHLLDGGMESNDRCILYLLPEKSV